MFLQATLHREGLQHLHCFRQLPHQLTEAGEAVQQLMAADLLSLLRFQALPHLQDHILAAIMQHQEYLASGSVCPPKQFMISDCLAALPCDTLSGFPLISDAYEGMSISSDLPFVIRGSEQ